MMELEKDTIWAATIRKDDMGDMDEATIKKMIVELNLSFQRICWNYGLHN